MTKLSDFSNGNIGEGQAPSPMLQNKTRAMIIEVNNLVDCWISKKFISLVLEKACKSLRKEKKINSLSVALVSKKTIKSLNQKYRRVNKVTDVLSFDDPCEIIICWDQLVKQAKEHKQTQKQELRLLLVHGLLHILGYDHHYKTDKIKMREMEARILNLFK